MINYYITWILISKHVFVQKHMNNILSLKTVGLSYASTNLSFAFALYFNISMFLLYHNPPLFSITRRTCPNVFLFGVQIPVDACPLFGLKRRSFLFVIDNYVRPSKVAHPIKGLTITVKSFLVALPNGTHCTSTMQWERNDVAFRCTTLTAERHGRTNPFASANVGSAWSRTRKGLTKLVKPFLVKLLCKYSYINKIFSRSSWKRLDIML